MHCSVPPPPWPQSPEVRRQRGAAALSAVLVLLLAGASTGPAPAAQQDRLAMVESAALEVPAPAAPEVQFGISGWEVAPTEPPVSVSALPLLPAVTDTRVDLTGIPARVLEAYRAAADRLAGEQPGCDLPWSLLAGIGRVESGHGTYGGAAVAADGRILPEIIGMRLDGAGPVALIRDTDGGAYDRDLQFDRAVGPMQFIPTTWEQYGADADGDGRRDPHDIDDVALAAGRYLCAAARGSLTTPAANVRAVYAYNHSYDYVRLVLTLAAGYANMSPDSLGVDLLPAPATGPVGASLAPPGEGGPPPPAGQQPGPTGGGEPGGPPAGGSPQVQAAGSTADTTSGQPASGGGPAPAQPRTASTATSGSTSTSPSPMPPSPSSGPAATAPTPKPTPTPTPTPTPSPSSGSGLPTIGGLPVPQPQP